ncbi:MAG: hypothetical protein NTY02_16050, partial [Acidobacteria bacterium]|nr:hypothetical protein [Acidobacteriota bacterium]
MRTIAARDRPREKLVRAGVASLGDNELLALVLGAGTSRMNALGLANMVLEASGGVHGLPATGREEFRSIPGVGEARAAQILAAIELGRRTLLRPPADRVLLRTPRDVAMHLLPEYGARPVEQFGIVLLDTKHQLIKTVLL